jgi:hypothetical protein
VDPSVRSYFVALSAALSARTRPNGHRDNSTQATQASQGAPMPFFPVTIVLHTLWSASPDRQEQSFVDALVAAVANRYRVVHVRVHACASVVCERGVPFLKIVVATSCLCSTQANSTSVELLWQSWRIGGTLYMQGGHSQPLYQHLSLPIAHYLLLEVFSAPHECSPRWLGG